MQRYLWGAVLAGLGQIAFIYWNLGLPLGAGPAYTLTLLVQYAGIAACTAALIFLARALRRQADGRPALRTAATAATGFCAATALLFLIAMLLRALQSPIEETIYSLGFLGAELTWLSFVVLGLLALGARPRPALPAFLFGVIFLATIAPNIPLPYRLTGPAGEPDTSYLLRVEGGEPHPGRIYGLTLWGGDATLSDYLLALVGNSTVLLPSSAAPALAQEDTALGLMMTDSEAMAKAVGLQLLGKGKGATPTGAGAVVTAVMQGTPADGHFQVGDLIVGYNGATVTTWAALLEQVQQLGPGVEVTFRIQRADAPQTLKVVTAPNPGAPAKGMIGISGADEVVYDIPVPITTSIPAEVGGPSLGLALTLQVIDQSTPGGITNGWRVAATGQILPAGKVGPVGGLRYKVLGAERADAGVIFVPRLNYEEALSAATAVRVVPVDEVQDALDWLQANDPDRL